MVVTGSPNPSDPIERWFRAHLPPEWAAGELEITSDADEILVVVDPHLDPGAPAAAERFRAATRDRRMEVAAAAETRFGRRVSWGVRVGDGVHQFTTASVPVMTRLRLPERQVLDTLIDAGVARSRSDALAWCVRLVGRNEDAWIAELRAAFRRVEEVREKGPRSTRRPPTP